MVDSRKEYYEPWGGLPSVSSANSSSSSRGDFYQDQTPQQQPIPGGGTFGGMRPPPPPHHGHPSSNQEYMVPVQNFPNFTNGYGGDFPTQGGPLPAHIPRHPHHPHLHHHPPPPLPAHLRSNPYHSNYAGGGNPPPSHHHNHPSSQQTHTQYQYYPPYKPHHTPQQQHLHQHHLQQQPPPSSHHYNNGYYNNHHSSNNHEAVKDYSCNNYYDNQYNPQYEAPINLTPPSSSKSGGGTSDQKRYEENPERTILNTPSYNRIPSSVAAAGGFPKALPLNVNLNSSSGGESSANNNNNESVTKPQTISVPTCIPMPVERTPSFPSATLLSTSTTVISSLFSMTNPITTMASSSSSSTSSGIPVASVKNSPSVASLPLAEQSPANKDLSSSSKQQLEVKKSGLPGPGSVSWKRKSQETDSKLAKRIKASDDSIDPYDFDEDSDKKEVEISRFGRSRGLKENNSQAYKFKNALLTRGSPKTEEEEEGDDNGNSFVLDTSDKHFMETCDSFIQDLNTKTISISRRPSVESWKAQIAAVKDEKKHGSPKKKKKDSLKQQQQQVLNEQQQIIRKKESVPPSALKGNSVKSPPDILTLPPVQKQMQQSLQQQPQQSQHSIPHTLPPQSLKSQPLLPPPSSQQPHHPQLSPAPQQHALCPQPIPSPLSHSRIIDSSVRDGGLVKRACSPPYPPPPEPVMHYQQPHPQYQQVSNYQPSYSYVPPQSFVQSPFYPPQHQLPLTTVSSATPAVTMMTTASITTSKISTPKNSTAKSDPVNAVASKANIPAPKKGGTLWALPIVPKLPQKPSSKDRKSNSAPLAKKDPVGATSVKDVWLSAFGAKSKKAKEESIEEEKPSSPLATICPIQKTQKTYLDIPPEVRRRPKPNFGGIIHFAPDWEKAVKLYHETCRVPVKLIKNIRVNPKILNKSILDPKAATSSEEEEEEESKESSVPPPSSTYNYDNTNPDEDLSPQKVSLAAFRSFSKPSLLSSASMTAEIPRNLNHVVDSILENRKKLRTTMGRMYKVPVCNQKKKKQSSQNEDKDSEDLGLMATPGLPLLTSDTTDILIGSNYGNFRRQTLLRYLDLDQCSELKAKMLDWKPEVFETKTRRQSNQVKAVTAFREIFGIDLPEKFTNGKSSSPVKRKKRPYNRKVVEKEEEEKETLEVVKPPVEVVKPKEELPLVEEVKQEIEEELAPAPTPVPTPSSSKAILPPPSPVQPFKTQPTPSRPKKTHKRGHKTEIIDEDDLYEPTPEEEELQSELQKFALELLDDNPSWSDKIVIQNLVIWEPIDPVPYVPEKKPKKYYHRKQRKRRSGLDFTTNNRNRYKNTNKSKEASSANTPEPQEVVDVTYTLDQIVAESKGWVIDKGAGETILHRASKMGYPDVAAYALDMVKIPPSVKDNAGIPPIHKAAFKGHGHIVNYLLRYGADPNTNVKGTRPLHEALEGGDTMAVYHLLTYGSDPLLYDYSGNMPIDLTEGDEEMKRYLTAVLCDLHGKPSERWNVSFVKDFVTPNFGSDEDSSSSENEEEDKFEFEVSGSPLPPYFQLKDYEGHFVKHSDLKHKASQDNILKSCFSVEMSTEEFLKNSHCCLLGGGSTKLDLDRVKLYRVDDNIKKILGISETHRI